MAVNAAEKPRSAVRWRTRMRPVTPRSAQVYVSVRETAVHVKTSPRTVKRWIAAGLLPATRLPSPKGLGQLRIRLSDVEVLMSRGIQS